MLSHRTLFLAYLAFVIYGSLVPLELHPLPWKEAVRTFLDIPTLSLGIRSRADWVANILLFIPLSFLACGVYWPASIPKRLTYSVAVLIACFGLSLSIEFAQLFFPPRTVSQNDIQAETIGAMIGIAVWWAWGTPLSEKLLHWRALRETDTVAGRILWVYLAAIFIYNVMPLDLTLSPVEWFHKWKEGRIRLIPFSLDGSWSERLYGYASDIAIWIPVAYLWIRTKTDSLSRTIAQVALFALAIELAQLFVYTRVTDTTDVLTATCGGLLGAIAGRQHRVTRPQLNQTSRVAWSMVVFIGWTCILAVIFWFPFDFNFEGQWLKSRLTRLTEVPFRAYYYGTEYRAITEVLHKVGFFLPLGLIAGWIRTSFWPSQHIRGIDYLVLIGLSSIPIGIELGQLALPDKYPGSTDMVLEWVGILIGFLGTITLRRGETEPESEVRRQPTTKTPLTKWSIAFVTSLVVFSLTLYLAAENAAVPYNVREMLAKFPLYLSAPALALVFLVACSPAMWWGEQLILKPSPGTFTWTFPLFHASVLFILVYFAVPTESLNDIIGSPILSWPPLIERYMRFVFLFAGFSVIIGGGKSAWQALQEPRPKVFLRWVVVAIAAIAGTYLVVIKYAATDNLTELIAGDGSWIAVVVLFLWLWLGAVAAELWLASLKKRLPWLVSAIATLSYLAVGYVLLQLGTATSIHKYGETFSALQFLLSPDRAHYLDQGELAIRIMFIQIAIVVLLFISHFPVEWWRQKQLRKDTP